ncbi:cytochrome c oxidase subunit II [Oceanicola sp. 22II-s10i]|uniref:leucyl aminopeptidase family protein n=1 Tax=Oceanicola sp. 22II-s10i TaxID=1317116 RepID=UPI000B523C84|nr:leucyl aminopeptidase family protein [Oceanicola sp. 22II-s10i]OWU85800.1 cytochrome c oxidase subunit II [Oceanicola sp. 22II-s10i]
MPLTFAPSDAEALTLTLLTPETLTDWVAGQDASVAAWIAGMGFDAGLGKVLVLPGADGAPGGALFGLGTAGARKRGRFHLAKAADALPEGTWRIDGALAGDDLDEAALGWLLSHYSFDRYKARGGAKARLAAPEGVDSARQEAIAAGEALVRDLINTPASDMGPDALEMAARDVAGAFGAAITVVTGEALLEQNFPMIHAVGRAAAKAPRLIEMTWGDEGPALTLVGKGVCFDTGGLDIKPAASMLLMKKDMGGAANVLGLARTIMALGLKVKLRVLIPAVENAISGDAFRPGDILTSRKGLTVEINNTDAEGRLVLGDALAYGAEAGPDLMISMATLTGAARVAVGPDLAPYYSDDEGFCTALTTAAGRVADPVWRLPFWEPYEAMIEPGIADLDNAPRGGFAGSITAALFLRRFAGDTNYAHFDIYGWKPAASPGFPMGGAGQGWRAILAALPEALSL